MVKIVHVPQGIRQYFRPNDLSGWTDGIAYQPSPVSERKRKRRAEPRQQEQLPLLVTRMELGELLESC